ncbi:hypothetical protein ABU614_11985 [Lysobacter firmicutimachus]|uniref:Transmembrane protein n=1 Tax=Lysobacter firmicutimachus TaxID=1792846 RepID=A0AAU8ML38_9GAMM
MTVAVPTEPRAPRQTERAQRRVTAFSWLLLALGTVGFAAFWVLLAVAWDRQCSWMAVLGALDIAWMLRLGGWRPGPRRAGLGLAASALIVLIANWGIAASQYGGMLGFGPLESSTRLGPNFAWTLFQLANSGTDLIWLALAAAVAVVASR